MTYRSDVTIDWSVSPRIIEVASPSTEITIQDLYDTLRTLEAAAVSIDDSEIVSGAGKENLGGGVLVGLTITLLNAQLSFEARIGPSFTLCKVSGGNLVAVDSVGADMDAIYPTDYVTVSLALSSSATLIQSSDITDIKTKTDQLNFTGGNIHSRLTNINGQEITGSGTAADPWGPA